jgi:hypothetical protein
MIAVITPLRPHDGRPVGARIQTFNRQQLSRYAMVQSTCHANSTKAVRDGRPY